VAIEIPSPEAVNAFFAREFPSAHAAHYRCEETGPGVAVARWPYDATQLRPGNLISGPTQFALADLAFWFMTFSVVGLAPMAVTSELYIVFLRPAAGAARKARGSPRVSRHRFVRAHQVKRCSGGAANRRPAA
jgi:acyl-coenzyme A thioesterase PaaI-like protein